jgi:hypothetical protein
MSEAKFEPGEGSVSADADPSTGFELSLETTLSHKGSQGERVHRDGGENSC